MKKLFKKLPLVFLASVALVPAIVFTTSTSSSTTNSETSKTDIPKILAGVVTGPNSLIGGKTSVASSELASNPASNATSLKYDDFWESKPTHPKSATGFVVSDSVLAENVTLETDLEEERQITSFGVQFKYRNIKEFNFEYKETKGGEWKVAASFKDDSLDDTYFFVNLPKSIKATNVRINVLDWDWSQRPMYFSVGVNNFQVFPSERFPLIIANPSVLKNLDVKASSETSENPAINVVDELEKNSFWSPNQNSNQTPHYIEITLRKKSPIKSYSLYFNNSNVTGIKIEAFKDGGSTMNAQTNSSGITELIINKDKATEDVSRVKLTITDWKGPIQLLDFGAYRKDVTTGTSTLTIVGVAVVVVVLAAAIIMIGVRYKSKNKKSS